MAPTRTCACRPARVIEAALKRALPKSENATVWLSIRLPISIAARRTSSPSAAPDCWAPVAPTCIAKRSLRGSRRRETRRRDPTRNAETASRSTDCAASPRRAIPICCITGAESRVQSASLDAVSMAPDPRSSSRPRLATHVCAAGRRAGRTPFGPEGVKRGGEEPTPNGTGNRGRRRRSGFFAGNIGGRAESIRADRRFAQPSRNAWRNEWRAAVSAPVISRGPKCCGRGHTNTPTRSGRPAPADAATTPSAQSTGTVRGASPCEGSPGTPRSVTQ